MRSNNKKVLGAVAVAGVVGLTGSAFTAGGVDFGGTAEASRFVGGNITQTVSGATINSVKYNVNEQNDVVAVALGFADGVNVNGKEVSISLTGYTCGDITALASTCTATTPVKAASLADVVFTVTNPLDAA